MCLMVQKYDTLNALVRLAFCIICESTTVLSDLSSCNSGQPCDAVLQPVNLEHGLRRTHEAYSPTAQ
jgi:hypothetical protein